jgi:hypothetical protein
MPVTAVTDIDEAFMANCAPSEREKQFRASFQRLLNLRKSEDGIGRKTEIDQNLDLTLDNYLNKLTRQELSDLHKRSGIKCV